MLLVGVNTSLMRPTFTVLPLPPCSHMIMMRISWKHFVSVGVHQPTPFIPQLGKFPSHHGIFPFFVDFLAQVHFMTKWYLMRKSWMEPTTKGDPIYRTVVASFSWHIITFKTCWRDKGKWVFAIRLLFGIEEMVGIRLLENQQPFLSVVKILWVR